MQSGTEIYLVYQVPVQPEFPTRPKDTLKVHEYKRALVLTSNGGHVNGQNSSRLRLFGQRHCRPLQLFRRSAWRTTRSLLKAIGFVSDRSSRLSQAIHGVCSDVHQADNHVHSRPSMEIKLFPIWRRLRACLALDYKTYDWTRREDPSICPVRCGRISFFRPLSSLPHLTRS